MKIKCLYDLGLKKAWWSNILAYPLTVLFLIDFHLNWKQTQVKLRGDNATNISSGLARLLGFTGRILYFIVGRKG